MSNVNIWLWVLALIIAYLLGNISPSTLLAKAKGIDIHKEGSGNAGTTNALRVMGKKAGVITLVVDVLKGTIAVLIGFLLAGSAGEAWCVLAVFCGHVWPVFYKFKGGKGVATAFGALLGLNPLMALLTRSPDQQADVGGLHHRSGSIPVYLHVYGEGFSLYRDRAGDHYPGKAPCQHQAAVTGKRTGHEYLRKEKDQRWSGGLAL